MVEAIRLVGPLLVALVVGTGCCKQGNATGDDPSKDPPVATTAVQPQPGKAVVLPSGKMPATTSVVFLHHSTGEAA